LAKGHAALPYKEINFRKTNQAGVQHVPFEGSFKRRAQRGKCRGKRVQMRPKGTLVQLEKVYPSRSFRMSSIPLLNQGS
jgi:hypothetical protein